MSQNQGDFEPVVKGGYTSDGPFHVRNWKALSNFLRTNFVTFDRLADGSVGTVKIADLAVTNAKITDLQVDKLTAGTLTADVLLSSTIKTAESGQRVEIDQNGIRLNDGSADVVNIPVSGTASFQGGVTASSLASAASTLSGATQIDAGGSFVFSTGLADPGSGPTISWGYVQIPIVASGLTTLRSIEWDGTDNQWIGCSPLDNKVYAWDAAGGGTTWTNNMKLFPGTGAEIALRPYGVTRMGSFIYIVSLDPATNKIYIQKWTQTAGVLDSVSIQKTAHGSPEFSNFNHLAGMTNDGTNICIGFVKATGDMCVSKWNTSLVFQSTDTIDAGFETTGREVYDVQRAVVDGGTWWVIFGNTTTGAYEVRAFDSGPSPLHAEDFTLPGESRGLAWDGSVFYTTPSGGTYIRTHTEWRGSSTVEHVKFAWYDSGGPSESIASAQAHTAFVQRASLRVSWPPIPTGADSVRVYFLENGSNANPAAGAMKRQGTETGSSQMYDTYNSGGAADATSTSFPDATPATLVLPRQSSAPSSPVEGQMYHNTTSHKTQIYDGTSWNNLW